MTLSASGQWLVDVGMRMMGANDQAAWLKWTREPKRLSPPMASLALGALEKLMSIMRDDISAGRLSEDDELDAANDLDLARTVARGIEQDLQGGR